MQDNLGSDALKALGQEVRRAHPGLQGNRERLLKESVMREFFGGVVAVAEKAELVSDEHFSVDGSLLRAWNSHKSMAARRLR
ncbi:MAG: hypothetical protein JSR40_06100 [Proteobacteria bacterium]|nr:hypothetical protein [Pseudomonadota bacterium]